MVDVLLMDSWCAAMLVWEILKRDEMYKWGFFFFFFPQESDIIGEGWLKWKSYTMKATHHYHST
jgi:hypothetical protein